MNLKTFKKRHTKNPKTFRKMSKNWKISTNLKNQKLKKKTYFLKLKFFKYFFFAEKEEEKCFSLSFAI